MKNKSSLKWVVGGVVLVAVIIALWGYKYLSDTTNKQKFEEISRPIKDAP